MYICNDAKILKLFKHVLLTHLLPMLKEGLFCCVNNKGVHLHSLFTLSEKLIAKLYTFKGLRFKVDSVA